MLEAVNIQKRKQNQSPPKTLECGKLHGNLTMKRPFRNPTNF
ncbi:hypothetical protein LEP1GSC125_0787 [Leptospira mayottensis 200901122]|uniref:Uncharacterized protein n=1 Tax=Leptospira mayottensis 200901122 TaxID=1193010 RepID=A0AA87MU69_9LEPT|nr:hypothetical protein LEP1GSC125_0787 [Leptospira mayottensis 200901122]